MNRIFNVELDLVDGIVVVYDFHSETTIMPTGALVGDYVRDSVKGCLGFEASESELDALEADGYRVKGR